MPDTIVAPSPPQAPLYAVVVVNTALTRRVTRAADGPDTKEDEDHLTRAFHYIVPDTLRTAIREGQLVWVPFGARQLQGVIIGFDSKSPVEATREIEAIAGLEPVISPLHIALAHWISEYYLAPLHRVMLSMLPPGIVRTVEVLHHAVAQEESLDLSPEQRRLYDLLIARGPLTLKQIRRQSRLPRCESLVTQLHDKKLIQKQTCVQPPAARASLEPVVRLAVDPLEPPPLRSLQQKRVIDHLSRCEVPSDWLPLRDVASEAGVSQGVVKGLVARGLLDQSQRRVWREPLEGQSFVPVVPPPLTPDQAAVWGHVAQTLDEGSGKVLLLEGVTGSGKTEIYLRAVRRTLAQGRDAIVLVPEIALTPQTIRRFAARFRTTLAVLHSRLTDGERYDQWERIRAGELRLVIGSRSAIFAPLKDPGLVILDEEHEWTYKQDQVPHYHARDVAVWLARHNGATCILGSATPDLESAYRAERGEYTRLVMPRRIMGHRKALERQAADTSLPLSHYHSEAPGLEDALYTELPPIDVVDMRSELRAGNTSIFSRALRQAIDQTLAANEQAILFLNRRGSATFVMCRDCGHVLQCPRCDLPLTFHSSRDSLLCHRCGFQSPIARRCPACFSRRIRYFGIGTQRVETLVGELYPQARVVRWDLDTTGGKNRHEEVLDQFIHGEADVMVGTQMIAKGLDLPRVTLVGVVTADTMLHLPDLRAGERTFQLLTQVAGRAGRSVLGGRVIIQTYTPQHPAIQAASHHDYARFYAQEIAFRREHWYPPLARLVRLELVHRNANEAAAHARRMHEILRSKIERLGVPEIDLIGPAPCFFSRLRGRWRWQILIRGRDPVALVRGMHFPLGWRVQVDPISLL